MKNDALSIWAGRSVSVQPSTRTLLDSEDSSFAAIVGIRLQQMGNGVVSNVDGRIGQGFNQVLWIPRQFRACKEDVTLILGQ